MSMTDPGPTPPKRSKPSSDETGKCDIPGRPVPSLGTLAIMIDLEERSKEESPVSSRVPLRRQLSRKYSYREKSPKYDTIQDNISRADFVLQVNRKCSSLAALYITW